MSQTYALWCLFYILCQVVHDRRKPLLCNGYHDSLKRDMVSQVSHGCDCSYLFLFPASPRTSNPQPILGSSVSGIKNTEITPVLPFSPKHAPDPNLRQVWQVYQT